MRRKRGKFYGGYLSIVNQARRSKRAFAAH